MSACTHRLYCLGYPELRTNDGSVVRVRVKKHLALLIYLAVERRRGHDRDRLVDLLWSRVSAKQGRHSFATALSALRSILGQATLSNARNVVRFNAPFLDLDLDLLDRAEEAGPDAAPLLKIDGFLSGFDIDDAPEFSLWKEREQFRRSPAIQACLLGLIDKGRRRGSHEDIVSWAERLLQIEPSSEEGIRAKVEGLALAGNRMAAIRAFDDWRDYMSSSLNLQPSGPVVDIIAQLRRSRPTAPPTTAPVARQREPVLAGHFIGRESEHRLLYDTWESANQFIPQYLFLEGESGIGKTTLARHLLASADLQGATLAHTQSFEMEQSVPYSMAAGLVSALLGRPGFSATSPSCLAQLATMVPQVAEAFPNLPPGRAFEGESARLHFAEAVLDLLTALSHERPVLIVADDLHFADRASQAVLRIVARRLSRARVMLLGTFRQDADGTPPLVSSLAAVPDGNGPKLLRLDPMSDQECGALLSVLLQEATAPNPTERRALIRAAAGSPMAIELMASGWKRHGRKSLAFELGAFRRFEPHPDGKSNRLERLIDQHLGTLTPSTRQVLFLASALGPLLNRPEMYAVGGLDRPTVLSGLSELARKRILRSTNERLDFANELARAYAYQSMPPAVREELHKDIANRLAAEKADGAPVAALTIAWHLVQAGRRTEATDFVLEGARDAILRGSPDDAILALETFLDGPPGDHHRDLACLLTQGHAETGRWADALRLASAFDQATDPSFQLLAIEARWQLGVLAPGDEHAAVDDLLRIASAQSSPLWPRAIAVAAFMAGSSNDPHLVTKVEVALPATTGLPPAVEAKVRTARAVLAFHQRLTKRGEEEAMLACATLDSLGVMDSGRVSLELGLGAFKITHGEYAKALPRLRRAMELAQRIDNSVLVSVVRGNLSIALFRLGLLEEAIAESGAGILENEVVARLNAAYAHCASLAMLGRHAEALDAINADRLLRIAEPKPWTKQKLHFKRADIALLCGRRVQAIGEAHEALRIGSRLSLSKGTVGWWARWAGHLGAGDSVILEGFVEALGTQDRLDALDRFELLSAVRESEWLEGYRAPGIDGEIRNLERKLPAPTVRFLRSLSLGAASSAATRN